MSRALALLGVLAATLAGCSEGRTSASDTTPRTRRPPDAPPDADLLALVPDGAHLLVTVDLRRLRRFWRGRPWAKTAQGVGGAVTRRLPGELGEALLSQADVLVLSLWLDGGAEGSLLALARGADRGHRALGAWTRRRLEARRGARPADEYRGVPLWSGQRDATAVPTKRTVLSGPTPLVKHSLDLLRAVPGYASAREDRTLMALWRLVTGPGTGRAPVLALATRFPPAMRQRLRTVLGLKQPPLRGALRMSLGSWVTVRGFLDCPDAAAAGQLIKRLKSAVVRAGSAALTRRFGLRKLLSLLQVHQEGARVHLQWFAPVKRLDPVLGRLVPLLRALSAPSKTPPPRKRAPAPRPAR